MTLEVGKRKKMYRYKGQKLSATECARLAGISRQLFHDRVENRGWSAAAAIETPAQSTQKGCTYCGARGHYRSRCEKLKMDVARAQS